MQPKVVVLSSALVISFLATITTVIAENDRRGHSSGMCPSMCTCSMIDKLKRADCSHEQLINAYTDVPTGVEILDLSINKISSIEKDDFQEYKQLIKLFLSENSIETISMNAFANLKKLLVLDLSHNRLEKLHEDLFETNENLIELNLSHNNFMAIQNQPFLKSPSIMTLDLSECKIPQIYENSFVYLPKLTMMDLSGNVMITLPKEAFAPLKRLRIVELYENRWQCDNLPVRATINWMKKRVDSIQIENCFLNPHQTKAKFEKMELDPHLEKNNREEVPIDQVWHTSIAELYLDQIKEKSCAYNDEEDTESRRTCENLITCQHRFSELYFQYVAMQKDRTEHPVHHTSTISMPVITMLVGMFIGALFGSFLTYTVVWSIQTCIKRKQSREQNMPTSTRAMRREFRERNRFAHTRLNESPTFQRANRQTIGCLPSHEQSQIYGNHENTRQFLVNLFSKRQPLYLRNNSQISNLHNRYIPPTPIRDRIQLPIPTSPAALSTNSFTWQASTTDEQPRRLNQEDEPMLRTVHNGDNSHQCSTNSVWNNGYDIHEQSGALHAITAGSESRETPPPPYLDCTTLPSNDVNPSRA
ncbi:uncharacterized protein LOC134212826 isoform X2 [Armigeres subalbatus]|uniref:uncharacterized protein LOC134212826 isoform X2 n=1 Tax=Armigeres subalbatus TaxID=124917 RepID=UPI002ED2EB0B